MRLKILILVGLGTVAGWQGKCQPHLNDHSGDAAAMAAQEQQYRQEQAVQQTVAAAQKAANQAAEYAKQAAVFNNQAAHQATVNALEAAKYARLAAQAGATFVHRVVIGGEEITLQEAAASAVQFAANAKQSAEKAEIDSIIANLEKERDEAIAKIKAKYYPGTSDLDSQQAKLKTQAAQLEAQMSQSEKENAKLRAKQLFKPTNPWRMLDGKVCSAKEESWFQFTGKILEIRPNGILVDGDFGPPLEAGFGKRDLFVENFPVQVYPLADGEGITHDMKLVAHMSEKSSTYQFTNTTIDLHVQTVRRLDYGKIVTTPPPDLVQKWNVPIIIDAGSSEIAQKLEANQKQQAAIELQMQQMRADFDKEREPITASYAEKIKDEPTVYAQQAKQKAEDAAKVKKKAVVDRVLKLNQEQADNGDPIGLLRMGERYRDGDGVDKDLAKARDYFTKAAAAGSPTAADDLKVLPAK
jgi:hypothetical protein